MPTKQVEKLQAERHSLRGARGQYLQFCEDIAGVVLPHRSGFTTEQQEGGRRGLAKFDSTGAQQHQNLKSALSAMIKPIHEKWLFVRPVDEKIKEEPEVLLWCEDTEQRMWNALYDRRAQFLRFSGETDDDLVAFGQGHLYMGLNRSRNGLSFRSWHIRDVVFSEDMEGKIVRVFLDWNLSAQKALELVGGDPGKLPKKIQEELKKDKPSLTRTFKFTLCIYPNPDWDPRKAAWNVGEHAPYTECIIADQHDDEISRSGYFDFPVATPRWDTSSGEFNARSPASIALGDILSLQQVGKTILKAGHLAVEPPLVAPHNAIVGRAKIYPGGMTYYNADAISGYGRSAPPVQPLYNNLNLPYGQEIQKDLRDQVERAFLRHIINLPIDGPQMTATEIMQRRQEFLRMVGPVLVRLEADYSGHLAERVFNLMRANNALMDPPEVLLEAGVRFSFISPIFKILKQAEMDAYRLWMEDMAMLAQTKGPHVFDQVDEDVVAREAAMVRGMPQRWLNPVEKIGEIRERRAKLEEMARMKEDAAALAPAAAQGAKAISLMREPQKAAA